MGEDNLRQVYLVTDRIELLEDGIEALKPGDDFIMFEPTERELVFQSDNSGQYIFKAKTDPYINDEGHWEIEVI